MTENELRRRLASLGYAAEEVEDIVGVVADEERERDELPDPRNLEWWEEREPL